NLSRSAQAVALDLAEFRGRQVIEVLGRSVFLPVGEQPYQLTLAPHSFFWFEMPPPESDIGDVTQASHPELVTLVMPHGWADLSGRHNLPQLERDVIPGCGRLCRRSEEHTSELQSRRDLVCRLLLEKKKHKSKAYMCI